MIAQRHRGGGLVLTLLVAALRSGALVRSQDLEPDLPREQSGSDTPTALDQALSDLPPERPSDISTDLLDYQVGSTNLRLIDLSVDLLVAVGSSTESDESLQSLQGGGHDPRKRGFTLQNLELSATGAVDPYFTGEVHLNFFIEPLEGESKFELEEAFFTTLALPLGLEEYGVEVEGGFFFTEFGRHNPRHPHQWEWLDAPVVTTRFFGADGMRQLGARVGWLTPLPWFSEVHLGVQAADGETMASFLANDEFFEERPVGGRPYTDREVHSLKDFVYLARWDNSWDISETVTTKLGISGLVGPNATGRNGQTLIYGGDLLFKWQPVENRRGWPFVMWQTELLRRDYKADDFNDPANSVFLDGETLHDWGLYSEVLWGFFSNWAAGFRIEYASGSGQSVGDFAGRDDDPFRDDRQRYAPLIAWQPTHFSRLRLQYNYDRADRLANGEAHSVWFGVEIGFGAHPGHTY